MSRTSLAVVNHPGSRPADGAVSAQHAVAALAALGQPTRLQILRLLMRAEPEGRFAGAIAAEVGCPRNTLSSHLAILARTGLVRGTRAGRAIVYRANLTAMHGLLSYLVNDCCNGHPELCGLLPEKTKPGCKTRPPSAKQK